MDIQHIFVVGAGTMGNGIAQTAAVSGFQVTMMDVVPEQLERARTTIARSVEKLASKGIINEDQKNAGMGIAMANSLGVEVIAEGVETEKQRNFLELHGCRAYQGNLYGKPVPVDELERKLLG